MAIVKVNGRELDSTSVTFVWGSTPVPITEIAWGDALETEMARRMGGQHVQGTTPGQYTPDAVKIKVYESDYQAIVHPLLPANGYGNYRKDALLRISDPEMGSAEIKFDKLRLTKKSATFSQGPSGLQRDVEMTTTQITENGKTINTVPGNPATGAAAKLRV